MTKISNTDALFPMWKALGRVCFLMDFLVRGMETRYNRKRDESLCVSKMQRQKGGLSMKIDMHCHVKEGSIDSKVSLEDYITLLKKKGFQGMVITDHNTYNGYRYWKTT